MERCFHDEGGVTKGRRWWGALKSCKWMICVSRNSGAVIRSRSVIQRTSAFSFLWMRISPVTVKASYQWFPKFLSASLKILEKKWVLYLSVQIVEDLKIINGSLLSENFFFGWWRHQICTDCPVLCLIVYQICGCHFPGKVCFRELLIDFFEVFSSVF